MTRVQGVFVFENMNTGLEKLSDAVRILAEVRTIPDAKHLVDMAEAARVYAKQADLGLDAQNHAAEIKIRAQRKAGELLAVMDKHPPGPKDRLQPATELPPKLEDLGIEKTQSHRWQQLAALPVEVFEQEIAETKADEKELTTGSMLRKAKEVERERNHEQRGNVEPPDGKYRVIYADPPWSYGNSNLQQYGHASFHYPSMTISELCELPIKDLAEDDAVLFLWVTSPLLAECFPVIRSWGFQYKTSFVWDKVKHNFGHYNSVRHELLLVCTRGSCTPDVNQLFDSVQTVERGEHSEKPEVFRTIIDTLYVYGKKIELFARSGTNDQWERWGNEVRTGNTGAVPVEV